MTIQYFKMNFDILKSDVIDLSLTELEEMMPFEREIYINLLEEEVTKRNKESNEKR